MEILLNRRELLDLGANLRDVKIACIEGRCWLTQAGDSRDLILRAGGSYAVTGNGHLIITATEPCRLLLTGPQGSPRQGFFRLIERLHRRPPLTLGSFVQHCR